MLNKLFKPAVVMIVGIGGLIVTNVLTARGTRRYELEKKLKEQSKGSELTMEEKIPLVIKNYAASFVAGILTGGVIFAGNKQFAAIQATGLTAYGLLNTRYRKYRDYILKKCGIDDVKTIEDGIDKVLHNKPVLTTVKKLPGGKTRVTDTYHHGDIVVRLHAGDTEVFTDTTMEELVQAEYEAQHIMTKNGKISYNQFAEFFGQDLGADGEKWGVNQEFLFNTSEDGDCWIDFQEEYDANNNYYDISFPMIVGWEV